MTGYTGAVAHTNTPGCAGHHAFNEPCPPPQAVVSVDQPPAFAHGGMVTYRPYPYREGDHTVIGPECLTDNRGVISYRGENYYTPDATGMNVQVAPYPYDLDALVTALRYRRDRGWKVELVDGLQRDMPGRHTGESRGLTLVVTRKGPNSYNPAEVMKVAHFFAVPPATYNRESWMRWLFDRLGNVDDHERMEDFALAVEGEHQPDTRDGLLRPYAPNHGPGWDPYLITAERTPEDRRTSFTGKVNRE